MCQLTAAMVITNMLLHPCKNTVLYPSLQNYELRGCFATTCWQGTRATRIALTMLLKTTLYNILSLCLTRSLWHGQGCDKEQRRRGACQSAAASMGLVLWMAIGGLTAPAVFTEMAKNAMC